MKRIALILLIAAGCSKGKSDPRNTDPVSAKVGADIMKFTLIDMRLKNSAFDPFDPNQAAKIDSAYRVNYSMMTGQK